MAHPDMLIKALKGAANFIGDLGDRDRTPYDELLSALEEIDAAEVEYPIRIRNYRDRHWLGGPKPIDMPSYPPSGRVIDMPDYLHLQREAKREREWLEWYYRAVPDEEYRPVRPDWFEFNEPI